MLITRHPTRARTRLLGTAVAGALSAVIGFGSSAALAQARGSTSLDLGNVATAESVRAYWTPERLASAVPMLPRVSTLPAPASAPASSGRSTGSDGAPPSIGNLAGLEEVLMPAGTQTAYSEGDAAPMATDGVNGFFTTTRVFPNAAVNAFPNTTIGKLFFTDSRAGGNFVCSAAVVRQRVVATAGHCVAKAGTTSATRYFYSNFLFVPQLTGTTGPIGTWTPNQVTVANLWYTSNGSVPNAGDWGYLRINDRFINGATRRIGDVTGYLGYQTLALSANHLSVVGYPCNLDSCQRMQITHAQIRGFGGSNTYYLGSAMRGGASGGPWILDYGVLPAGTVPSQISQLARNRLVGVSSYGPVSTSSAYLGASEFNNTWLTILNNVCGLASTRNCAN